MRSLPILCYHQIGDESKYGRRLCAPPARLSAVARRLLRYGGRLSLLDEWPPPADVAGAITFDDGFLGAVTEGAGALERVGARGVFYVVAGKVGRTADWEGGSGQALADWPELAALEASGHRVGNHTWSHAVLGTLTESEAILEIEQAQNELRCRGFSSPSFCFPYGSEGGEAALTQFATATTLRKGPATPNQPPLTLSRIVMAYSDGPAHLIYKWKLRPWLRRVGL